MSYFLPRLKLNDCLLRPCVVPLLSYLFLHYLCPQASKSAALEAMYVTKMRTVLTLTAPTTAPVWRDTRETDNHAKV